MEENTYAISLENWRNLPPYRDRITELAAYFFFGQGYGVGIVCQTDFQ